MKDEFVFNRVRGLKFLYDFFPYYFDENRINLYFVEGKTQLNQLKINKNFDLFVLKRSGNNKNRFISDLYCKDNRFFKSLDELKKGAKEFDDEFEYCVECHRFAKNEDYYSDRLAIAQFTTEKYDDFCDKVSFIPSITKGVNTRDNRAYLEISYPYDSGNIYKISKLNEKILKQEFDDYEVAFLTDKIHKIIENIKETLENLQINDSFQLILRIDQHLNLLPIDFRTSGAWSNKL